MFFGKERGWDKILLIRFVSLTYVSYFFHSPSSKCDAWFAVYANTVKRTQSVSSLYPSRNRCSSVMSIPWRAWAVEFIVDRNRWGENQDLHLLFHSPFIYGSLISNTIWYFTACVFPICLTFRIQFCTEKTVAPYSIYAALTLSKQDCGMDKQLYYIYVHGI